MSWLSGQKMQAARITEWKTPYKLQQIDVPQPGEYELLLKTKAAGYCHTDAMVQEGKSPLGASTPITGSHEPAGVVVAMGSKARALGIFKEGSRVCGGLMVGTCGACVDCREFGVNYCRNMEGAFGVSRDGAFAQYCLVDARGAAVFPDSMEFAQAAPLSCAGVTIYAAIKRAGLKPGDTLGIVGLGSLGILGVQMARKMGFKTVGVDSRPEPVELAKSLGQVGSDYLVLQSDTSPTEAVKQIKQMSPNAEWDGLDAVILATDTQESFKYATEVLKRHGTFVLVGQPDEGITFSFMDLIFKDIRVVGSLYGSQRDLQECIELCVKHDIKSYITTWSFVDVNKAVEAAHDPKRKGKNVVVFD